MKTSFLDQDILRFLRMYDCVTHLDLNKIPFDQDKTQPDRRIRLPVRQNIRQVPFQLRLVRFLPIF